MPDTKTINAEWVRVTAFVLFAGLFNAPAAAQDNLLRRAQDFLGDRSADAQEASGLSEDEVGGGLKEALRIGADTVIRQLGASGGFESDPAVRIALPASLGRVKSSLDRIGMSSMLDDLEVRMNRAAEVAMPKATGIFLEAINAMTLEDVMDIYRGPNDAATRYFQSKMSAPLARELRPVVDESLADTGTVSAYRAVMDRYNRIPLVRPVETDLSAHVVQKGMDGIFHYLAQEEAAIRNNPIKRSTELLQRVFGN